MADKREKAPDRTTGDQERIGRTTDEPTTDAADDDFEDVDDLDDDEEDADEDETEATE